MRDLKFISKFVFHTLTYLFILFNFFSLNLTNATENSYLHLGLDLDYKSAAVTLSEKNKKTLNEIAVLLKNNTEIKMTIYGFSDLTGNDKKDEKVAIQRAENIKNELIGLEVSKERLFVKSLVEYDSIIKNKKTFGQKQNRRIVLRIENRSMDQISKIIVWAKSQKNISIVDPLGSEIKNISLLVDMLENQNSDILLQNKNTNRIPASK